MGNEVEVFGSFKFKKRNRMTIYDHDLENGSETKRR